MASVGPEGYLEATGSRENLRLELTNAIATLQHQIEKRSIGTTGRSLVIEEVKGRLAELREALADLDEEDARRS